MTRTVVYRAGGFTNCGIGYTKFSQEELAERRDRAMTENEKIVRDETEAIECLKSNKPTSGYLMLQESIDMATKALEEVQQYRAIGTLEECRAAMEKQTEKKLIFDKPLMLLSCPICGHYAQEIVDDDGSTRGKIPKYCSRCGQKLDWRVNNEKID